MKKINPLVLVPGTIIWPILIIGVIKKNDVLIGTGITIILVFVVGGLIIKGRRSAAARAETSRIWSEGKPARARVTNIATRGGGLNDNPLVQFELSVEPEGQDAYQVSTSAIIDKLAIPRIQPGCELEVRIDPSDPSRVALDDSVMYLKHAE